MRAGEPAPAPPDFRPPGPAAAHAGLADATVRERHAMLGMEIVAAGPAAMAQFLADSRRRVGALIRDNDIRLDG